MSTALPLRPRLMGRPKKVAIVASQYNDEFTDALLENTKEELKEIAPALRIKVVRVPGAFEIPVVVESLLEHGDWHCVITLGLIIRGQTPHGDLVANSVTSALQKIAVSRKIPVIHEVVICADGKQAYARCIGKKLNRGREAARAAVAILQVMDTMTPKQPVSPKFSQ